MKNVLKENKKNYLFFGFSLKTLVAPEIPFIFGFSHFENQQQVLGWCLVNSTIINLVQSVARTRV